MTATSILNSMTFWVETGTRTEQVWEWEVSPSLSNRYWITIEKYQQTWLDDVNRHKRQLSISALQHINNLSHSHSLSHPVQFIYTQQKDNVKSILLLLWLKVLLYQFPMWIDYVCMKPNTAIQHRNSYHQ